MTELERELLEQIKTRSLKLGGPFVLASGKTSNYYIDGRTSEVFSRSARLIGEVIYERTRDLAFDAIGGLQVGAVPLTTAAVIAYDVHGRSMEGFWVRDNVKDHGTKKRIEGFACKEGSRVVIVDDVVTTGSSSVKAVEAVREVGANVICVLTLVDRLQGARETFQKLGIPEYRPIFDIRDLGVKVEEAVQAGSH
jgi:orotate phosphoribosyltransferase